MKNSTRICESNNFYKTSFRFLKPKLIDRLCFHSHMEKWCNGIPAKLSGSWIYNSRFLFEKRNVNERKNSKKRNIWIRCLVNNILNRRKTQWLVELGNLLTANGELRNQFYCALVWNNACIPNVVQSGIALFWYLCEQYPPSHEIS